MKIISRLRAGSNYSILAKPIVADRSTVVKSEHHWPTGYSLVKIELSCSAFIL